MALILRMFELVRERRPVCERAEIQSAALSTVGSRRDGSGLKYELLRSCRRQLGQAARARIRKDRDSRRARVKRQAGQLDVDIPGRTWIQTSSVSLRG